MWPPGCAAGPWSRPTRARGLKLENRQQPVSRERVAPHTGAWIETSPTWASRTPSPVAPHAGAWIETLWLCCWRSGGASRPTRARGIKHLNGIPGANRPASSSTKTPTTPRRAPAPPHWLPPFRNASLTRGNALPSCSAAPTSIAVCWRGYWRATRGVPTDVCDASKAEGCLLNQETSPSPQAIPVWPAQRHTRARPAQRAPARRRPGHRSTDR